MLLWEIDTERIGHILGTVHCIYHLIGCQPNTRWNIMDFSGQSPKVTKFYSINNGSLTLLLLLQAFDNHHQSKYLVCSQCESWRCQFEHFFLAMGCKYAFQTCQQIKYDEHNKTGQTCIKIPLYIYKKIPTAQFADTVLRFILRNVLISFLD